MGIIWPKPRYFGLDLLGIFLRPDLRTWAKETLAPFLFSLGTLLLRRIFSGEASRFASGDFFRQIPKNKSALKIIKLKDLCRLES
jgi:hypothetical protein